MEAVCTAAMLPALVLVPAGIDPGFEYIPGSSRQRGAAKGNMGQ